MTTDLRIIYFYQFLKILFPHLDAHWIHHCCPKIYSSTMAPPIFQASTAVLDIHALVISKGWCLAAHKANKTERPRVEMRYDEMTSKKLPPKKHLRVLNVLDSTSWTYYMWKPWIYEETSLIFKDFWIFGIQMTNPKVIIFNELFQSRNHLEEGCDGFDNEGRPWIPMGTVVFHLRKFTPWN